MTTFSQLELHSNLLKALDHEGYDTPTPIQAEAIPHLLDDRDLLGIAQTGTGKTAAFALPTLNLLLDDPRKRRARSARVLVLAPTRELAGQIAESFNLYARFMDCAVQTVFGGVKINRQIRMLEKGADVLVATPGRLLDLVEQKAVTLADVDVLILDEADQMLDLGFLRDLKKIIGMTPKERQTLLFSATMPKDISDLAQQFLIDPVRVSVAPQSTTAERVDQRVIHVATPDKLKLLGAVLRDPAIDRALVFTRTKHGADKVVRALMGKGIEARAIHGNKSQPQRLKALAAFKEGTCRVLVATDIAARGIDIDGVSHVVNYEMPNVAEQYVHRIGRTARAGRAGQALSLVAEDELYYLREIEKLIRIDVQVAPMPEECEVEALPTPDPSFRPRKPKGPAGGRWRGQGAGQGRGPGRRKQAGGAKPKAQGAGGKPRRPRNRGRKAGGRPVPA